MTSTDSSTNPALPANDSRPGSPPPNAAASRPSPNSANACTNYFDAIIAAVELGISNALIEGINAKIRLINARGYGHHSAQTLTSMIYLCLGGLQSPATHKKVRSRPEIGNLTALEDAALVDAAGGWARVENAACARKLAVMAEIFARRTGLAAEERDWWWVDPAGCGGRRDRPPRSTISQGMALHQTHRGVALRDRLPSVARLFEKGLVSDWLVRTIVWRTHLITDPSAMTAVDSALADRIAGWGAMSIAKTEAAIDALVDKYDPGALRRCRESASSPTVQFGSPTDVAGIDEHVGPPVCPRRRR